MIAVNIKQVREALDGATPGPWEVPDQSARFQEMWVDEDEPDDFDAFLARVAGWVFAACATVGAVLIIMGFLT